LVNRYSFSGAEDVEFAINKLQITNSYSAIRASGVPIIVMIEDDSKIDFFILNDVWRINWGQAKIYLITVTYLICSLSHS